MNINLMGRMGSMAKDIVAAVCFLDNTNLNLGHCVRLNPCDKTTQRIPRYK